MLMLVMVLTFYGVFIFFIFYIFSAFRKHTEPATMNVNTYHGKIKDMFVFM
jgi:hypothetical protein